MFYLPEISPVLSGSLGESEENVALAVIVVIIEHNFLDEIACEGDEKSLNSTLKKYR